MSLTLLHHRVCFQRRVFRIISREKTRRVPARNLFDQKRMYLIERTSRPVQVNARRKEGKKEIRVASLQPSNYITFYNWWPNDEQANSISNIWLIFDQQLVAYKRGVRIQREVRIVSWGVTRNCSVGPQLLPNARQNWSTSTLTRLEA